MDIEVFLIKHKKTKIFEINFAYNFFFNHIKKVWKCTPIVIESTTFTSELQSDKDVFVFIFDALSIPSKETKDLFLDILSSKVCELVVPVANESNVQEQRALIPYQYWDISTFSEVATLIAKQTSIVFVEEIDPFIIGLSKHTVKSLKVQVKDVPKLAFKKAVAKGAFVHRFKNVFNAPREDLVSLVPPNVKKVLDIGCAEGGFGKTLKKKNPTVDITGVELSSTLANKASQIYNRVLISDIEHIEFKEKFDLINCGDILEHLYDPWKICKQIYNWLNTRGYFIGNIPNVGHWSIVKNLIEGKFEYLPLGLLCVGHIRFFTKQSIITMLTESGFRLDIIKHQILAPTPEGEKFLTALSHLENVDLTSLNTYAFLFRVQKQ